MGKKKQKKFDDTQSEISSINGSGSTYQSVAGSKEGFLKKLGDQKKINVFQSFCYKTLPKFESEDEYDEDMRFKESVDGISAKNSKTSLPALKFVKSQMQKEYMITLLSDYYQTLSTEIYRALKKAKVGLDSE